LHIMSEEGGNTLKLSTFSEADLCTLQISASVPQFRDSAGSASNLSLSASQGILQEHRGQIVLERRPDAFVLRMELPPSPPPLEKNSETTAAMLWQSQPYA